jgi:phosphoglucosamine mutase
MIYFGTDGIRGKAYDTLPLLRAYQLGIALKKIYHMPCVIGSDTRASSLDFVYALIDGLDSNVRYLGVVPTPVLAFESQKLNTLGVMITASHNPFMDNGLKVFLNGQKLSKIDLERIEAEMILITSYTPKVRQQLEVKKNHYHTLYKSMTLNETFKNYTVDAAHGAASYILKDFIQGSIINQTPDGKNINEACGATHLEAIIKGSLHDIGFSLDGDADRLLMVYKGRKIFGDEIVYLLIKDEISKGFKPNVALSIMTNPGVLQAFDTLNIKPVITPVGDQYLLEAIASNQATYGAEASGHIITPHSVMGDGILVLKLIVDMISRHGIHKVISWLDEITMMPMETHNIKASKKVLDLDSVKKFIQALTSKLKPFEMILVRPSGTEDLIRVTVAKNKKIDCDETIRLIKEKIEGAL